jgi:hypothetical protein
MHLNQMKRSAIGMAVVAAAMAAGSAHAYVATLDVAGIFSNDVLGSASNETRFLDLVADARIIGISWDVSLFADAPSWLSEMSVDLNDGAGGGFSLSPGFGVNNPGTESFSGTADLVALGSAFSLGASGRLNFEFFETFDDFANDWDGIWRQGTLTVTYVPEPASFGLAGLALLGLGATTRRRPS